MFDEDEEDWVPEYSRYREEPEEPEYRREYSEQCADYIKNSIPLEKRRQLANDYGPNWACIISGCGDQ